MVGCLNIYWQWYDNSWLETIRDLEQEFVMVQAVVVAVAEACLRGGLSVPSCAGQTACQSGLPILPNPRENNSGQFSGHSKKSGCCPTRTYGKTREKISEFFFKNMKNHPSMGGARFSARPGGPDRGPQVVFENQRGESRIQAGQAAPKAIHWHSVKNRVKSGVAIHKALHVSIL